MLTSDPQGRLQGLRPGVFWGTLVVFSERSVYPGYAAQGQPF
jgi:hypothetical protein